MNKEMMIECLDGKKRTYSEWHRIRFGQKGLGKSELLLKGIDFEFINKFAKAMGLPEGSGQKNILAIFMNRLYLEGRLK